MAHPRSTRNAVEFSGLVNVAAIERLAPHILYGSKSMRSTYFGL